MSKKRKRSPDCACIHSAFQSEDISWSQSPCRRHGVPWTRVPSSAASSSWGYYCGCWPMNFIQNKHHRKINLKSFLFYLFYFFRTDPRLGLRLYVFSLVRMAFTSAPALSVLAEASLISKYTLLWVGYQSVVLDLYGFYVCSLFAQIKTNFWTYDRKKEVPFIH